MIFTIFWGVSNPFFLSSSLALNFFRLFFSGPPPYLPGWPATPCTCNGLWLLVAWQCLSKRTIAEVTYDTVRSDNLPNIEAGLLQCLISWRGSNPRSWQ
jgi:hypothetical protein